MLQLKVIESRARGLVLGIDPKHVKIHPNCSLTIVITDQQIQTELSRKILHPPFANKTEFGELPQGTLIKVKYTFINGNTSQTNNLFTFTKATDEPEDQNQPRNDLRNESEVMRPASSYISSKASKKYKNVDLSNTEQLMRTLGKINNVMTNKQLDRAILAARHSKDAQDFVKSGYKSLRPELRQDRLKRTILLSHGIQMVDTIYRHSQGRELFKNDWFMGPFYSYDANQKQMRKKP